MKIPDELQLIEANQVTETFNKNTTSNIGEKSFEEILEDNENDDNLSRITDQAPLNMSRDQQLDKVLSELHSDNNDDNTFTDPTTLNLSLEPSTINEEYEGRNQKSDVQTDDIKLDEDKK